MMLIPVWEASDERLTINELGLYCRSRTLYALILVFRKLTLEIPFQVANPTDVLLSQGTCQERTFYVVNE